MAQNDFKYPFLRFAKERPSGPHYQERYEGAQGRRPPINHRNAPTPTLYS